MSDIKTGALCDNELENVNSIRTAVQKLWDKGRRKFAIAPMGKWGKKTKEIMLDEFHVEPQMCFDNVLFNNRDIYPLTAMKNLDLSDMDLFIVVENDGIRTYLFQQAVKFISNSSIQLVTLCNPEQRGILHNAEKVHLDFLCTGFHKCGTTSLQAALQKNKHIFLPDIKETFFASDMTETYHEKLKQSYPKSCIEKESICVIGGIEPIYASYPASVSEYFGTDLKILFCVKNPVEALKSCFKMAMREVAEDGFPLIKKYRKICSELMQEFIEENYRRFIYIDYIHMYERYYSKSNIKIIVTEELIQDPLLQMNEIQDFIGLPGRYRINYKEFPYENRGDTVFKNMGGAYVNNALNHLRMGIGNIELYSEIDKIRKQVLEITTIPFNFDQYKSIWEPVWDYYFDSVKQLEDRLGRSLEGIWY